MQRFLILLFVLFSVPVFADYPAANFGNPRETMNYFLKTMKGYKLGDSAAIKLAIKALDTSKAPHAQVSMAPTLPTMPPLRSLGLTRERSDYGQTSQMRLPSEYTAVDLPDLLGFSWTPPQPRSRSATQ